MAVRQVVTGRSLLGRPGQRLLSLLKSGDACLFPVQRRSKPVDHSFESSAVAVASPPLHHGSCFQRSQFGTMRSCGQPFVECLMCSKSAAWRRLTSFNDHRSFRTSREARHGRAAELVEEDVELRDGAKLGQPQDEQDGDVDDDEDGVWYDDSLIEEEEEEGEDEVVYGEEEEEGMADVHADSGTGTERRRAVVEDDWNDEWSEMADDNLGGIDLGKGGDFAEKALEVAQLIISHPDFHGDFDLHGFRVVEGPYRANVRVALDKLSDVYGSPTADEIEKYLTMYWDELKKEVEQLPLNSKTKDKNNNNDNNNDNNDNKLVITSETASGKKTGVYYDADAIDVEVTSPGVERMVKVPSEFGRFKGLPMVVKYRERESLVRTEEDTKEKGKKQKGGKVTGESGNGKNDMPGAGGGKEDGGPAAMAVLSAAPPGGVDDSFKEREEVLSFLEYEESSGKTVWQLADAKVNREAGGRKGTKLTKKQRDRKIVIQIDDLSAVRLHLDF